MSVEVSLFQNDVLADDQPMRSHFFQQGQHAAYMLVGVHEGDDDRELAPGFYEVRGFNAMTAEKSGDGVNGCGRINIFFAQVTENFHMQRLVMPLVGFVQIDGDLYRHGVSHFTTLENVVNDPQKPMTTSKRHRGSTKTRSVVQMTKNPTMKLPIMLMIRVP
jgi:hypothetical protein